MKKIILFLSIFVFIISCGPSLEELKVKQKAELEQQLKTELEQQKENPDNTITSFDFTDNGHHVMVHKLIMDSCVWYVFCGNPDIVIHNPHCNKH